MSFKWAVSVETTEAPLPNCTSVGELVWQRRFSLDAVLSRRKLASAPVSTLAAASGFDSECPTSHFGFLLFFSSWRIALNAFCAAFLRSDSESIVGLLPGAVWVRVEPFPSLYGVVAWVFSRRKNGIQAVFSSLWFAQLGQNLHVLCLTVFASSLILHMEQLLA